MGLEPLFNPFLKRRLTNIPESEVDSIELSDREHQAITEKLKQLQIRHSSVKEDEEIYQSWVNTAFISISRDEWTELKRETHKRYTVIAGEKEGFLTKMHDNLARGYGPLVGTTQQGFTDKKR